MAETTAISWSDATWNPWQGCTKVSDACTNCYMFRDKRRYGQDPTVVVRSKPHTFRAPLNRKKFPSGTKVFTCSWSDFFHEAADAWRPEAWSVIKSRPDLVFQILTKRPERIGAHLPADWGNGYSNVWLGATVENQAAANYRLPFLLSVPALFHFVSCEPLLGPVDLDNVQLLELPEEYMDDSCYMSALCTDMHPSIAPWAGNTLSWVIAGGESGPNARPSHPDWFRQLRDQCQAAGVAFHFKQWGEWLPFEPDTAPFWKGQNQSTVDRHIFPADIGDHQPTTCSVTGCWWAPWGDGDVVFRKAGTKAAGRALDGRTWDEFPEVRA